MRALPIEPAPATTTNMLTQILPQLHPKGAAGFSLSRTLSIWSACLTLLLIALYLFTPTGKFLDLLAVDFLLTNTAVQTPEKETTTITIDDNSLSQYGQWPWPRYRIAMLIEKLEQSGAATIAINILFPEPDQTSPARWKQALHQDLGYSIDTSAVPPLLLDHDAYLANTLRQSNAVLGYEFLFTKTGHRAQNCTPAAAPLNGSTNQDAAISLYQPIDILCNNNTINQAKTPSGFFNGTPDSDGILRRLPLLLKYDGTTYPSFALQILFQTKNTQNISIAKGLLGTKYILPGRIPIDSKGNMLLNPAPHVKTTHISAADILNDSIDPALLKDKIAFIGITASGLAQKYRLTTANKVSMVDIHKLTYQSLTAGYHTTRGDLYWAIELFLTCLFTLALVYSIARHSTFLTGILFILSLSLIGGCSLYLCRKWGLLFSPLLLWSCLLTNFFILRTVKYKFLQQYSASEAGNALQLLETSQETLQSILNTIPDIVFRLDKKGRIIFISSAVSRYKRLNSPLLGRSIFDLVVPEDQEKAQHKLNERRTGSRATQDLEVRLRLLVEDTTGKSEFRYFSVSAAGLYREATGERDAFIGTQGIVKDITERKQIEHQLLQAKKMEAIGNLAAGVAHDLNNILSGIVSYPDMILADTPKDDPLYNKISLIKKSGQKAAIIVQDLLTLARRNIHRQEVCDLNTIISDYLESTEHNEALQRNPNVTVIAEFLTPQANIIGSCVHMSKTVMNLINNGMEAIVGHGQITITTSKTKLNEVLKGYEDIPAGNYISIQVRDSGTGIPEDDITKIFEPFYTQKPSRRKGTGLGMTIIWATVKDHDGFFDITSTENVGTTISLYLPATKKQITNTVEPQTLPGARDSETILIIDDQEEQLIIGKNILEKLGYTVFTAQKSTEVLDLMQKRNVDLLIVDMIMPGQLDGLEIYKEILRLHPKQKAIIASGYSESDRVKSMQKLGAGNYIQKPYSMEKLAHTVRTELDQ
ncbi:CHASE2 domain-containing protein [Desulforhopalus sp. 52FAK]